MVRALAAAAVGLALAGSAEAGDKGKGAKGKVFAKMDANGDGVVTKAEFQAYAQAHKGKKGKAAATATTPIKAPTK